jgi:hypothetical protein
MYTENFALLRWGGSAWAGLEQWSCGVKLKHLGGSDLAPMQEECVDTIDECVAAVTAFLGTVAAKWSQSSTLNWVSLNVINANTERYEYPNAVVKTENLNVVPVGGLGIPQVATCVTTRGIPVRGPAAFGRFYIPCGLTTLEADGQLPQATALGVANAASTFLTALSNIASGLGPDAWAPWHYSNAQSGPADSSIQEISVGRIYDTQRRRRNTLLEEYVDSTTWPPA